MAYSQSLARALTFLEELIQSREQSQMYRLPPIATLASQARVCVATMSKAIVVLRSRKKLVAKPRSGIVIVDPKASFPVKQPPVLRGPLWQRTRASIIHDCSSGQLFTSHSLPTLKQLGARYKAGPGTISKVIRDLTQNYGFVRIGNRLSPPAVPPSPASTAIILVARGDDIAELRRTSVRTTTHAQLLEDLCSRRAIRLEIVTGWYQGNELCGIDTLHIRIKQLQKTTHVAGIILWDMALSPEFIKSAIALSSAQGIPIAVLDEIGLYEQLKQSPTNPSVQWYSMACRGCEGAAVAHFCQAQKYRSALFLAPSVHDHVSPARASAFVHTFNNGVSTSPATAFAYSLEGLQDNNTPVPAAPQTSPHTSSANSDRQLVPQPERLHLLLSTDHAAHSQHIRSTQFETLGPLLKRYRPDVLIGYNDTYALACRDYLATHQYSNLVAVIGFDNSFDAFVNKLTSYDFNGSAYHHAMIDFLLNCSCGRIRATHTALEFNGYVVERQSTRDPADKLPGSRR